MNAWTRRMRFSTLTAILTLLVLVAMVTDGWSQEARTWTDDTGDQKTLAEFVKMEDNKVTLRKPGTDKTVTIPFDRLSDEDQIYVEDYLDGLDKKRRAAELAERKEKKQVESAKEPEQPADEDTGPNEVEATNKQRTVPNNVINGVRGAVYRQQTMDHLRQIGMALGNYQSQRSRFPTAAIKARDGKPLLSWRVAILPMLEEDILYRQFHLNEPWDSPHNLKLVDQMPKIFESPGSALENGYTNYLAVAGTNTVIAMAKKGARPADIRDGMSKTLMLVEVDDTHAVPWTKPMEYEWDVTQPLRGLANIWPGQFFGAFADGRVARLDATLDVATLNGLATRAGGERIKLD